MSPEWAALWAGLLGTVVGGVCAIVASVKAQQMLLHSEKRARQRTTLEAELAALRSLYANALAWSTEVQRKIAEHSVGEPSNRREFSSMVAQLYLYSKSAIARQLSEIDYIAGDLETQGPHRHMDVLTPENIDQRMKWFDKEGHLVALQKAIRELTVVTQQDIERLAERIADL